jgi:hypothetical protein
MLSEPNLQKMDIPYKALYDISSRSVRSGRTHVESGNHGSGTLTKKMRLASALVCRDRQTPAPRYYGN